MSEPSTGGKFQRMVEVRLSAVRVDLQSNTPVLLLTEAEGLGRTLPIFIGAPEATAIAFAIQGVATPRPMTHDLLRDVVEALGASLERVVITELRSATYFAELQLKRGTGTLNVSSRPSDAVALAVRTGSPLFVADELMDAEGILLPSEDEDEDGDPSTPRRTGGGVPPVPRHRPARGLQLLSTVGAAPGRRRWRSTCAARPRRGPGRSWSPPAALGVVGLAACSSPTEPPRRPPAPRPLDRELVDLVGHDLVGPGRSGLRGP